MCIIFGERLAENSTVIVHFIYVFSINLLLFI